MRKALCPAGSDVYYKEFMDHITATPLDALSDRASEAADVLGHLANEKRLLLMCHLATNGECHAGALGDRLDLSQAALSQHLSRLRDAGLVTSDRRGRNVYYRVTDRRAARLLVALRDIYAARLAEPGEDGLAAG